MSVAMGMKCVSKRFAIFCTHGYIWLHMATYGCMRFIMVAYHDNMVAQPLVYECIWMHMSAIMVMKCVSKRFSIFALMVAYGKRMATYECTYGYIWLHMTTYGCAHGRKNHTRTHILSASSCSYVSTSCSPSMRAMAESATTIPATWAAR